MDATIAPGALTGLVNAVSSKSMAHRLLILAALANQPCEFVCNTTSQDIVATANCLQALNDAMREPQQAEASQQYCDLDCNESGSTLRFLLPVACALGIPSRFIRRGRLSQRPLAPLDEELRSHGVTLVEKGEALLASGKLLPGRFVLPGNVSSQYVSGLLLAASVQDKPTEIWVSTPVQSRPYITLTTHALKAFGQPTVCDKVVHKNVEYERFFVDPVGLVAPESCVVEGDWSNAAFWLAAGALEPQGITVLGLDLNSPQGDRAILACLAGFGARIARKGTAARATRDNPRAAHIDVSAIPDLVPPLAAVAATAPGTSVLSNAGRLRLKESDRLASVCAAINSLGGNARANGDDLVIEGVSKLSGGVVDTQNDHRIAMMGAVMATHAEGTVTIQGAECVAKSYPTFWEDYSNLGGNVTLPPKSKG